MSITSADRAPDGLRASLYRGTGFANTSPVRLERQGYWLDHPRASLLRRSRVVNTSHLRIAIGSSVLVLPYARETWARTRCRGDANVGGDWSSAIADRC